MNVRYWRVCSSAICFVLKNKLHYLLLEQFIFYLGRTESLFIKKNKKLETFEQSLYFICFHFK